MLNKRVIKAAIGITAGILLYQMIIKPVLDKYI